MLTKAYCEPCHEMKEYEIKNISRKREIKGIEVVYPYKEAVCIDCGSEVFLPEIRDENLVSLEKNYEDIKSRNKMDS